MLKLLVVTSCTGEKKYHPENQLVHADFQNRETFASREKELAEYMTPAGEMYTGMQHLRLMEGVQALRNQFGQSVVDLYIVSAGYGVIHENKLIAPYEMTFNSMNGRAITEWSDYLKIHEDIDELITQYDLVLFLLGDKYLKAIQLPFQSASPAQKLVFLAGNSSKKMIPDTSPYYFVEVGQKDAKSFRYGLVGLKGYLFRLLALDAIKANGDVFDRIYADPSDMLKILEKHRKHSSAQDEQLSMLSVESSDTEKGRKKNDKRSVEIYIPEAEYAANYAPHMKYFIPEWDDRVDPDYDFIHDLATEGRDPYTHDVYAHEIYDAPNYDGVLISRIIIEQNKTKKARIEEAGVHDFIRFNNGRPIMGDCGAFGYIDAETPPFETREILDYYKRLGFDIGVSIDHLIVGKYASDVAERNRRYALTISNADAFLREYKAGGYTFLPSGIAQGWDPVSYRDSVAMLIEMGYRHICLGGLVRTNTRDIIEILKVCKPLIPEYLQLHLFGIARPDALETFRKLGVSAMDSASHLRRAWLGSSSNYFALDGQKYAAIRVPPVDGHGVRVKKMVAEGRGTIEQFRRLETNAMAVLRDYDKGTLSLDDTLEAVLEYDRLIGDGRGVHEALYKKVLEDMPWKKCGCEICRNVGIDVVIFRGNNRNRRRGFHNTYVFYRQLKGLYPD